MPWDDSGGLDSRFGSIDGVVSTRVGYAGGSTDNPTYRSIGDHSETIQIDYDPSVISYRRLLDVFWNGHNCVAQALSRQYMSIIFYHNEQQRQLAAETAAQRQAELKTTVVTEINAFARFYPAEDYHQKYYLQRYPVIWGDLNAIYLDMADIIASTAAARINGYLGGNGTFKSLQAQLSSLGLSPAAVADLLEIGRAVLPG